MRNLKVSKSLHDVRLLFLSILSVPVDTYILVCSYVLQLLSFPQHYAKRKREMKKPTFNPRKILVSGLNSPSGLSLARSFHALGHTVVGADTALFGISSCCRFSVSLNKYFRLPNLNTEEELPVYIQQIEKIIKEEDIDIWIPCSRDISPLFDSQAAEIVKRKSACAVLHFDVATTSVLWNTENFINHVRSIGLPTLEAYGVSTRSDIHKILDGANRRNKKYVVTTPYSRDNSQDVQPILPRRTLSQTYSHISRLSISPSKPWLLQEYVKGMRYDTYSLVIQNEVVAFTAWPVSLQTQLYETLPSASALNLAMLKFVSQLLSETKGNLNGHLCVKFIVQEKSTAQGSEQLIFPISCGLRPGNAAALFSFANLSLAQACLKILGKGLANGEFSPSETLLLTSTGRLASSYTGNDFSELVLKSAFLNILVYRKPDKLLEDIRGFFRRLFYSDGWFLYWDPLPWWLLRHVQMPVALIASYVTKESNQITQQLEPFH